MKSLIADQKTSKLERINQVKTNKQTDRQYAECWQSQGQIILQTFVRV